MPFVNSKLVEGVFTTEQNYCPAAKRDDSIQEVRKCF